MQHFLYICLILSTSMFINAAEALTLSEDSTTVFKQAQPIEGLTLSAASLRDFYAKPEEEREELGPFLKEIVALMPWPFFSHDRLFRYGSWIESNNTRQVCLNFLRRMEITSLPAKRGEKILRGFSSERWSTGHKYINTQSKVEQVTDKLVAMEKNFPNVKFRLISKIALKWDQKTIEQLINTVKCMLRAVPTYTPEDISSVLSTIYIWQPNIRQVLMRFYNNRFSLDNTTWKLRNIDITDQYSDILAEDIDNAVSNLIKLSDELNFKDVFDFVGEAAGETAEGIKDLIEYVNSFKLAKLSGPILQALYSVPRTKREDFRNFIQELTTLLSDFYYLQVDLFRYGQSINNSNARQALFFFLKNKNSFPFEVPVDSVLYAFGNSRSINWENTNTPKERIRVVDNLIKFMEAFPSVTFSKALELAVNMNEEAMKQFIREVSSILKAAGTYNQYELSNLLSSLEKWKPNISQALVKFYINRLTQPNTDWHLEDIPKYFWPLEDIAPESIDIAADNLIKLSNELNFKGVACFIEDFARMSVRETQDLIDYLKGFRGFNLSFCSFAGISEIPSDEKELFQQVVNELLPWVHDEEEAHTQLVSYIQRIPANRRRGLLQQFRASRPVDGPSEANLLRIEEIIHDIYEQQELDASTVVHQEALMAVSQQLQRQFRETINAQDFPRDARYILNKGVSIEEFEKLADKMMTAFYTMLHKLDLTLVERFRLEKAVNGLVMFRTFVYENAARERVYETSSSYGGYRVADSTNARTMITAVFYLLTEPKAAEFAVGWLTKQGRGGFWPALRAEMRQHNAAPSGVLQQENVGEALRADGAFGNRMVTSISTFLRGETSKMPFGMRFAQRLQEGWAQKKHSMFDYTTDTQGVYDRLTPLRDAFFMAWRGHNKRLLALPEMDRPACTLGGALQIYLAHSEARGISNGEKIQNGSWQAVGRVSR